MRAVFLASFILSAGSTVHAQWMLQDSHTKASLRGIHYVGDGVAWASGTQGTVLRTLEGGQNWQNCAIPPGAGSLDFRGVQALSKSTAIVMSSGKGNLSRLYRTVDGCRTWQLLFVNPDQDGFWDSVLYDKATNTLFVLGDPVNRKFVLYSGNLNGDSPLRFSRMPSIAAFPGESAFAASNSLLSGVGRGKLAFVTGGSRPEMIMLESPHHAGGGGRWWRQALPFAAGESSGAFSIARRFWRDNGDARRFVIVGGDYRHPDQREQTAAFIADHGNIVLAAQVPPHGYRSAVEYDLEHGVWVTVGPNGTDISGDDGRSWASLGPNPEDIPGSDRDWNALSLPFVVGPGGRIGKLDSHVIDEAAKIDQHQRK